MDEQKRTVANIKWDTRELLNQVKESFDFKSDDQTVKFLCQMLMSDDRSKLLKQYLDAKK